MNTKLFATATLLLLTPQLSPGKILFSDTFERNYVVIGTIDGSTDGMVATFPLSPEQVYREEGATEIVEGTFSRSTMKGMAQVGLLHNFTTSELLVKNGKKHMRISLDVLKLESFTTGRYPDLKDRFAGFGLGFSLDGVASLADVNDFDGGCRGAIEPDAMTETTVGASGLFINYALNDTIQIFHDGILHESIAYPHNLGTLSAEFFFNAVSKGENADYVVYDDGEKVYEGTYTLANDENYVVFGARAVKAFQLDNLLIETEADGSLITDTADEKIAEVKLEKKAEQVTNVFIYDTKVLFKGSETPTYGRQIEKDLAGNITLEVFPGIYSSFNAKDIQLAMPIDIEHPANAAARAKLREQ